MTIHSLLAELNESQRLAAMGEAQHALVLAGAGSGKTKTIVARAAFLISQGVPAQRIQILTFTRRSAFEIVERVRMHLNEGHSASALRASTFHTWCISLIRRAPAVFGCKGYSIIDRDDQMLLFKVLRGKNNTSVLPTNKVLCDLYSYARNTGQSLDATLQENSPELYDKKDPIAQIMLGYEARKKERHYLDYDDILEVVAQSIATSEQTCGWVANHYDHLLVDEMQDTNPLQWKLIEPLKKQVNLFCVGDDAQSIYGFRGADFQNIHHFSTRIPGAVVFKLEQNYRSTQEILDPSNWLLAESKLNYNKHLVSMRGSGKHPQLHTFSNEWAEARWIVEDLQKRYRDGAPWKHHMILVRSAFSARRLEEALLSHEIPYQFIGGTKLLESAHVRDVLAVLRVVANPQDEIGWMRFLTLWKGIGETTAQRVMERICAESTIEGCLLALRKESKVPQIAVTVIEMVKNQQHLVAKAITQALNSMTEVLAEKYHLEWERRRGDFRLVEKLAEKHTSILEFIEEYLLDPVHGSQIESTESKDKITLITIHSAKGTECDVCYVINVSPGAYPSPYAMKDPAKIEEERRVLYVALTRAKNELIVTRQSYQSWGSSFGSAKDSHGNGGAESYFFNDLLEGLFDESLHQEGNWNSSRNSSSLQRSISYGIQIND